MPFHIASTAIQQIERGHLPDTLVRYGIRHLLKQRLQTEQQGGCQAWRERHERFVREATQGPIALVPEKANEQHYELPAEFFQTVLGPRRKYSCCYWPEGVNSLEQAEQAALAETCRRAEIANGMSVLDLGCGWGSLSLWIAEHYPACRVTAVSNSHSQREFIEEQAEQAGLDNLEVITRDMNDFAAEDEYDRVVSIEMFEHMRNHRELLRRISTWLKPAGKLFTHIFCHRQFVYPFESSGPADWMAEHFFTGGIMPSEELLAHYQEDLILDRRWRWNGKHYARTCRAWLENSDQRREQVLPILAATYGESEATKWLMRWRMFFMACEELFAFRGGNEWWVAHYLFSNRRR